MLWSVLVYRVEQGKEEFILFLSLAGGLNQLQRQKHQQVQPNTVELGSYPRVQYPWTWLVQCPWDLRRSLISGRRGFWGRDARMILGERYKIYTLSLCNHFLINNMSSKRNYSLREKRKPRKLVYSYSTKFSLHKFLPVCNTFSLEVILLLDCSTYLTQSDRLYHSCLSSLLF